jgi:7-cyano-7-deazaguanine reductase
MSEVNASLLGKKVPYKSRYEPSLLFRVGRREKREEIGIHNTLPFTGYDLWNCYELSWLNPHDKPEVRIAEVIYPADSEYIVESKSLKLYLNSFNNSKFYEQEEVATLIAEDLSQLLLAEVAVNIIGLDKIAQIGRLPGTNIDNEDIFGDFDLIQIESLRTSGNYVEETLNSHLLKSNCLVTGQPDWGSVMIEYKGNQIDYKGLLEYIVSFRNHNEFHEQCVERIFNDILQRCEPAELSVYARYTRRGGIDINPFRTNVKGKIVENIRLSRQ